MQPLTPATVPAVAGPVAPLPAALPPAPPPPAVSRERINAAMHAICASLAAAAATGMGAGTPHPGSLDEATLHHAALSTPVARSAPGGGLDAATLGAVLRAVANKRVGDLVIRGFEDSQRPGVLRFSLHDLGGVQSPDSAEAAEAADALIAVARTASEEAGPGAVAPGAAAAGTEAAGTLRPGARAQRAAAVKRHYANMAAGTQDSLLCLSLIQADQTASVAGLSEGEPDERSDGRPKRRSGPAGRRVASPAGGRAAPAPYGGEGEAAAVSSALGDVQLFLEDFRDELALKNADLARELAAARRDVRAQAAALDRLAADVAALRGMPRPDGGNAHDAAPMSASQPRSGEMDALKAELASLRALVTAGAAASGAGVAAMPARPAGSPGPSPLGPGPRQQPLPPATDAAGVARRAAQMLTAMPAAGAPPAWQPFSAARAAPGAHTAFNAAAPPAADEGAMTLAGMMSSASPPLPGALNGKEAAAAQPAVTRHAG